MTEALFDKIRMNPKEDIDLELKWAGKSKGGVASGGNDGNSESSDSEEDSDDQNDPIFLQEEEKAVSFSTDACTRDPEIESRMKWCDNKFPGYPDANKYCLDNFCNVCCEDAIPQGQDVPLSNCRKNCQKITPITTQKRPWAMCQESYVPNRSLGHFCEMQYFDDETKKNCKVGMCNLCCVTSTQITGLPVEDDNISDCYKQCSSSFMPTDDVILA